MKHNLILQLKNACVRFLPPFLIALLFVIITGTSGSLYSRTRDEGRHLTRGVMLLETGDYRINKHHPIFANVLNALPVVFIEDVNIPSTDSDEWKTANKDRISAIFTEINGPRTWFVPHILNPARTVTVFAIAISIILLYFVIAKQWGTPVALIFSGLYALEPNIIAHSSLVTTDAWIIPMIIGGTYALYSYTCKPSRSRLAVFILLSFLSLITKYSAIPISILWLLLLCIFEFQRLKSVRIRFIKALAKPALVIGIWFIALTAVYGFQFKSLAQTNVGDTERTESHLENISDITGSLQFLVEPLQTAYIHLKLPFSEYLLGFFENVILHNEYGHDTFLFGMYSNKGWWYYFPAAMAIKSPIPLLIGIAGLLYVGIRLSIRQFPKFFLPKQLRSLLKPFTLKPISVFIIVPVFFLLLSMKSSINLGYRHILPILPFAFLGIAYYVPKLWRSSLVSKLVLSGLGFWYLLSCAFIYPHYLSYFNEFIGGPNNGYRYLLDSNLTWDQDVFRVDEYIRDLPEGSTYERNPLHEVESGLLIIDADILMGRDGAKRDKTAWLREPFLKGEIEPVDRIGYTYFVFDIEPADN